MVPGEASLLEATLNGILLVPVVVGLQGGAEILKLLGLHWQLHQVCQLEPRQGVASQHNIYKKTGW